VRRLLSDLRAYLFETSSALVRGWDRVFFTPADPTALGLMRVAVGLLLLWSLGIAGFDLRAFFGSDGWIDPAILREFLAERAPWAWSFWFWVPDGWLGPAWVACLVVLVLFTVGLGSRVTAVLAWVIVVSTSRRVPMTLFGFDQIVSTWTLYLAVTGASGQAVSLDRFLARWRRSRAEFARRRREGKRLDGVIPPGAPEPTVSANLALRLIQMHLALIYGMAGLSKLQGASWWNGTAIERLLSNSEFRPFDLTWLAAFPLLLNLATHLSLALEISYPVLVWDRRLRPLVLALAVGMHVGIGLMMGLYEFAAVMIVGNLAFVPGSWLRSLVTGRVQPAGRLLYDGACPRCRAALALIGAADPDRIIEPIDLNAVDVTTIHPSLTKEACLRAMHLVRSGGRVDSGYDAVLTLSRWIPLAWPAAAIGHLPGVASLGRRVYNHLAATRPRDVPCTDEVCGLPPRPAGATPDGTRAAAQTGRSPR
jgi:predicted DCC family thiol-disulfide oxidoreductase YuxK